MAVPNCTYTIGPNHTGPRRIHRWKHAIRGTQRAVAASQRHKVGLSSKQETDSEQQQAARGTQWAVAACVGVLGPQIFILAHSFHLVLGFSTKGSVGWTEQYESWHLAGIQLINESISLSYKYYVLTDNNNNNNGHQKEHRPKSNASSASSTRPGQTRNDVLCRASTFTFLQNLSITSHLPITSHCRPKSRVIHDVWLIQIRFGRRLVRGIHTTTLNVINCAARYRSVDAPYTVFSAL